MSGKKRTLCPECGKHASGNFCHRCGATLGGQFCNQCGAELQGSFCNQCGAGAKGGRGPKGRAGRGGGREPAAAGGAGTPNDLPWWIAGAATFALVVVVGWTMVSPTGRQVPVRTGDPVPPPTADLSQLTPRETADQLFNRVMAASENGDTLSVRQFMPMAVQAYEAARPLDMDGLFHLALLQRTGGMFDASLAAALEILEGEPNHILGLKAAGEAAVALGREDEAAGFYQRILDNHDAEVGRPLPEYQIHSNLLSAARAEALEFLAGR